MANLKIIKQLADKINLSMNQLAVDIGVKYQTINKAMNKGSTSIDTLEKIAKRLDVSPAIFWMEEKTINNKCPECEKKDRLLESQDKHIGRLEKQIAKYEGNLVEAPKTKLGSGSSGINTPTRLSRSE